MRKFGVIFSLSAFMFAISCGPSAEEKAAIEKHIQDSTAAAQAQMEAAKEAARQQAIDDSIAQAAVADTLGLQ